MEKPFRLVRIIEYKIMAKRNPTTHNYKYGSVSTPRLPQPTRLTPQWLEEEVNPTISYNAFAGITTPQTLKIEGNIEKKKLIVLIDSGSTHNFIHYKVAKELNCFI